MSVYVFFSLDYLNKQTSLKSLNRQINPVITSHSKPISLVISSLVAEGLALRKTMEHA